MSSDASFVFACLEKDAGEYDKAILSFTDILATCDSTKKNFVILVYKKRAECYYSLGAFQNVIDDINKASQHGFDISKDDEFFYIVNHCIVELKVNEVINKFEDQARIRSRRIDYYRVVKQLNNLKLASIFAYRKESQQERERSQSADRYRR